MKHKFKVGDKVKIFQNPPISEDSNHYGEETESYDIYVGMSGVILELNGRNYDGLPCYIMDIKDESDGGNLYVKESVIELMP